MIIDINSLSLENKKKLNLYLFIKEKYKLYDLILGGSLSLIIQNIIPERIVNDLDICYHKFFNLPFSNTFKADSVISYTLQNNIFWNKEENYSLEKIDLFVDSRARYFSYKYNIGTEIKYINLQFPSEIMEAKLIYLHRGAKKHLNDILIYLNNYKKKYEKKENIIKKLNPPEYFKSNDNQIEDDDIPEELRDPIINDIIDNQIERKGY